MKDHIHVTIVGGVFAAIILTLMILTALARGWV